MAPKCPKCDGPAHRVYAQVTSPKTKRSTTVTLPAVFCGTLKTQVVGGRVVGTFDAPTGKQGGHGIVDVALDVFLVERRQAVRLTTERHKAWVGLPEPKPKTAGKAKKAPPAARKTKAAPKAQPKARKAGRAVSATPKSTSEGVPASHQATLTTEPPMAAAPAAEPAASTGAAGGA